MENFDSLGLPEAILHSLKRLNFEKPTPIQAQTIPLALEGKDILGSAQTGTGKTAAYALPLLAYLMANPNRTALVLTPTRELAQQVLEGMRGFMGRDSKIWMTLLIGGDSMGKQLQQLRNRPRLIIGTPGRINDHLERGTLKLDRTGFLVLDETDRMLDMGFVVQLERIAEYMNPERQTLMFSATIAPTIERLAGEYLNDPVRISVGSTTKAAEKITQEVIKTSDADKFGLLVDTLNQKQGTFIVFVKTKHGTEKLAKKLNDEGHSADAIHGDLRQSRRSNVISAFRRGKNRVLVATDVAARGLDIPHIEYVVNFDLPQAPEDFIHRIGRTGRAGAEGTAISFVSATEIGKWRAICRLMHPEDRAKGMEGFDRDDRSSRTNRNRRPEQSRRRSNDSRTSDGWRSSPSDDRQGKRSESRGRAASDDRRGSKLGSWSPNVDALQSAASSSSDKRAPAAERKFQERRVDGKSTDRRSEGKFGGQRTDGKPGERRSEGGFGGRPSAGRFSDSKPGARRSEGGFGGRGSGGGFSEKRGGGDRKVSAPRPGRNSGQPKVAKARAR
ncbi:DEAD/DEAH box helicase [Candidatus Odyssella acanthamoebae]|uniref:DEAD/DEAH box helicase n=1 Tax=Candidatus Odyssella acanthamoebae TaxID=91604 RepID=UPI00068DF34D|nr:DEAD/DEAH box helicase [Candidatus Paracaedibacter acanthamoebae]